MSKTGSYLFKRAILILIGVVMGVNLSAKMPKKSDTTKVKQEKSEGKHSANFQYEKEIIWENAGDGVQRQIMAYNDDIMMVKVKFEKGAIGTPHSHPHTQTTYIESGVFEFTTDGETKIVKAGDGVYMKPGVEHGCVCLEAGLLIDTFSPMRKDFLK